MASGNAWFLSLDSDFVAAVGGLEIVHLLQFPILHTVYGSPFYCKNVLIWQNRILPAMDLAAWLRGKPINRNFALAAVAAYQERQSPDPQYGAILLSELPRQIIVDDSQACDLPDKPRGWSSVAISCFDFEGKAVPVLNLPRIFSDTLLMI
jgi:chemotaxis signal transduction protein